MTYRHHEPGPNVAALLAERKDGCCVACDEPFPPGHRPLQKVCSGDAECLAVWRRAYHRDYQQVRPAPISWRQLAGGPAPTLTLRAANLDEAELAA